MLDADAQGATAEPQRSHQEKQGATQNHTEPQRATGSHKGLQMNTGNHSHAPLERCKGVLEFWTQSHREPQGSHREPQGGHTYKTQKHRQPQPHR
jgi:hypothetical protein